MWPGGRRRFVSAWTERGREASASSAASSLTPRMGQEPSRCHEALTARICRGSRGRDERIPRRIQLGILTTSHIGIPLEPSAPAATRLPESSILLRSRSPIAFFVSPSASWAPCQVEASSSAASHLVKRPVRWSMAALKRISAACRCFCRFASSADDENAVAGAFMDRMKRQDGSQSCVPNRSARQSV